jgi:hypothetical protein
MAMGEASDRELELKARELDIEERGLALEGRRARSERWSNPLTVAVIAAALAALTNAWLAFANNRAEVALESRKAEADRILEVLKIGEPERVRENLRFLIQLGLVQDEELRRRLQSWDADPRRAPIYLSRERLGALREAGQARRPDRARSAPPAPAAPDTY